MDRLAQRRFDPICNLLARPFSLVVWRRLKAQIQRFTLDLVEQKGPVGATRTTVCQTVWSLSVVQRDRIDEPRWTSLHDASDLTAGPRFRLAEQEQGVPASALVIIRCGFIPTPKLFNAQMRDDR